MLRKKLPPVHPGEILREMFIRERGLTITEVAEGLNVARGNLSAIVNERAGISPNWLSNSPLPLETPQNSGLTYRKTMSCGMRNRKWTGQASVILLPPDHTADFI